MVSYRGDSVAVYDAALQRISLFDRQGQFGRSFQISGEPLARRAYLEAGTSEGDFVLVVLGFVQVVPAVGNFLARDSVVVLRLNADGSARWTSPRLEDGILDVRIVSAGNAIGSGSRGANSQSVAVTGSTGTSYPVSRYGSVVSTRGLVHHYVDRTNELHSFDRNGRLVRVVRLPAMPVPSMPPPAALTIPKQSLTMVADDLDRIWLEVPRAGWERRRDWWVVSPEGSVVARSSTPERTEPIRIGVSRVLLRALDSLGVETLRACALAAR
jgi:hypothetical protein